jgi:hypothetical protein
MSTETSPNWKALLEDLNNKKKSTERELYYAVDRLLDEIRSGENFLPYLDSILELLAPLIKEPSWHLVQSVLFGFCSIVENLVPLVLSNDEIRQSLIQKITLWLSSGGMWYEILLAGMKNKKREVRDATAQFLGAISLFFSSTFKPTAISTSADNNNVTENVSHPVLPVIQMLLHIGESSLTVPTLSSSTNQPLGPITSNVSATTDSYETLEGAMMLVGYLLYKMTTRYIPSAYHNVLVKMLERGTVYENNQDHSRYIRLQAIRALDRAVRSGCVVYEQKDSKERDDKYLFDNIILARLNDNNIDVRKATASLFTSWALSLLDKNRTLFVSCVHTLLDYFLSAKASRWEHRHGLVYAFYLLCQTLPLVNALPLSTIQTLIDSLITQIKYTHPESKDPPSVTVVANSTALLALVELFISLYRAYFENERAADNVTALTDLIIRLHLQENDAALSTSIKSPSPATTTALTSTTPLTTSQPENSMEKIFTEKVLPLVHLSLSSNLDLQIDSGVRGVYRLVTCLPHSFLQPYIVPLVCRVFKNKFHASHPIQEQANRTWRFVVGGSSSSSNSNNTIDDEEFSQRENEFLRKHHVTLLDFLLSDAEVPNTDLREAAFKALEALFVHPAITSLPGDSNNSIVKSPYMERILQIVITELKGLHTRKGDKDTQEYPQTASLKALAAYCKLLTLHKICLQESTIETLFSIISEMLRSDSAMVVPACIDAFAALVTLNSFSHNLSDVQCAIAGRVWTLSYLESDYTIRMSALSRRMMLLPSQSPRASVLLSSLTKFGFDGNAEIEIRKAILEFLSVIFRSDLPLTLLFDPDAILTATNILGHALIDVDNRDEEEFLAISLRGLSLLLAHPFTKKFAVTNKKIQRNLKSIIRFLFYILLDVVDDFDVETFSEQSNDRTDTNSDDENEDSGDDKEEDVLPTPCPLPLKDHIFETSDSISTSNSMSLSMKMKESDSLVYVRNQMIYYTKVQSVLWLIVNSLSLFSQETTNAFSTFLYNILSKTMKSLAEWNASSRARLFILYVIYSALRTAFRIHPSIDALCQEMRKGIGTIALDANSLHESWNFLRTITKNQPSFIVSDFSQYTRVLMILDALSAFLQSQSIHVKEDEITKNSIETVLQVANWAQSYSSPNISDVLLKRLLVHRALTLARDFCTIKKPPLTIEQALNIFYMILKIISAHGLDTTNSTKSADDENAAIEGQIRADESQEELLQEYTNRMEVEQLLIDVHRPAMRLFDAVWNQLNDDNLVSQLVQQITKSLNFTKYERDENDDENSESGNEGNKSVEIEERNRIHFCLLENMTTAGRAFKIPMVTRQTLAEQCLQYLTRDEALDDEETFHSIVKILRGLAQCWKREDVSLFSTYLNTLLHVITTKKEILEVSGGSDFVDLFAVCAKLIFIWPQNDSARNRFLQQLADYMFNEDIEETSRMQFESVVNQIARDIAPEVLNLPSPTRTESIMVNEGFKTF